MLLSKVTSLEFIESAFSEEVKKLNLTAAMTIIDLGNSMPFQAWTYNGQAPGPEIRMKEGETLRVVIKNDLPEGTTIHWHGLPVTNEIIDEVPYVTQKPVKPGESFVYECKATPP